ncbi:hypothetical protein G6Y98_12025 [Clostridium perfringens]|uniref:hypothetical protein n=1 Tax=Clostridium perfringens TaxID=1502 RepID=UPI0013E39685|nr:hypothetical protein [Clostridium perfringens]NGT96515.1 hypothetical protein [Clostridium perfringens]
MIKELERILTKRLKHQTFIDDEFSVKITKQELGYKLCIKSTDNKIELFADVLEDIDLSQLMYLFIKNLYYTEVNWRTKEIHRTKSFLYRKAKQLATWSARNNTDKVEKINKEIVERYKETENLKQEVAYYKQFVSVFYDIKTDIEEWEWLR